MNNRNRRVAIVTGAGSGIGRATAYRLVSEGYTLRLLDVDRAGLDGTLAGLGGDGQAKDWEVDLLDRERLDDVIGEVLSEGAPALLVNNAGIGIAESIVETSYESWDRMIGVNLTAQYRLCHLVIPAMVEAGGGVIVNVASVAGLIGMRNRAAYCASKGGVLGLTRAIAVDHGSQGIRANAICPGTVSSEWIGKIIADDPDPVARRQQMSERQLDGKMGTPEEVAAGIAFLASDDGRFMNGAGMVMDGGMSMH